MALTTAKAQAVERDITVIFRQTAAATTPFYPVVCTTVPSASADEKYAWIGSSPRVKQWVGDRQFDELRAANYVLPNVHWESSLNIPRTTVDDDRTATIRPAIADLATEATYHPDELLFSVINNAENLKCFDGQNFYDTDHQWGDSGVQSNKLNFTVANTAAVTPTEFKASFHAALKQMYGFKRDNGTPYLRPTVGDLGNLICRVPIALMEAARQAFEQPTLASGESNWFLERPIVIPVPYMGADFDDGSDIKWDLDYLGAALRPFVFQARSPLRFQTKGPEDIEVNIIKAMTEARYNVGFLAWHTSVRTTFTV